MRQGIIIRELAQVKFVDLIIHLIGNVPFLTCFSNEVKVKVKDNVSNPLDNSILFHFLFETIICEHFEARFGKF